MNAVHVLIAFAGFTDKATVYSPTIVEVDVEVEVLVEVDVEVAVLK